MEKLEIGEAKIYFWADTGIAFQVVFGNGWGFVEIDQPEKYKDQERIMEYERQPPKKQEGKKGRGFK